MILTLMTTNEIQIYLKTFKVKCVNKTVAIMNWDLD